jgi:mono/diheme cytochrome c family protein
MVRTIVARLDLVDNHEELSTRLDLNDRSMAQSLIFGPSGDIFFVASQGSNRIEVYDSYTSQRLASLATGLAPQGMVLVAENDSARLFVHNYLSRSVSVFDVAGLLAGIGNDAPLLAEIGTVGKEKLASEVLKGKRIFYNAADPRMSRDGYLSCAACHLDGGSDGQVWDFTQTGEGLRNTISLHGRAGTAHGRLHWTANFDEIQDFEHDIRHFAGGRGFLDEAGFAATGNPLGKPKAGLSAELDALAAYVASLDRFPPSPYRSTDGTLSADAESGRRLFSVKGCARCHSGASFSDGQRHDVGTVQDSSGQGQGRPLAGTGFDTPTLLGVWNSAPYLHDGQAATLYEVLSNPAHTGQLSAAEQDRLVTYLLQLDGTAPDGTAAE